LSTDRAASLIAMLNLIPHPEGGYYGELYRSSAVVHPTDGRGPRPALTTIYFLLAGDTVSRWHRVHSDEVWHFYEGAPLNLWVASPALDRVEEHQIGSLDGSRRPVGTVPAGWWQAARSTGTYTLVGCTVGPGFDFSDFVLAADHSSAACALGARPALSHLL
jgi:predicted cupin superfamily sugar epimerase